MVQRKNQNFLQDLLQKEMGEASGFQCLMCRKIQCPVLTWSLAKVMPQGHLWMLGLQ